MDHVQQHPYSLLLSISLYISLLSFPIAVRWETVSAGQTHTRTHTSLVYAELTDCNILKFRWVDWTQSNAGFHLMRMHTRTHTHTHTQGQILYPQDMLTSSVVGNGERLACLRGMIFHPLTFSLIIIHGSITIILNHGSIHINVDVFRNIFYAYLQ